MGNISKTITSNVTELSNAELRKLGQSIIQAVVLATEKTIAHHMNPRVFPMPADPDALEHVLLKRFLSRPKFQQERAMALFQNRIKATPRQRISLLGELGRINLRTTEATLQQFERMKLKVRLHERDLVNMLPHGPVFVHQDFPFAVDTDIPPALKPENKPGLIDFVLREDRLKKLQELFDGIELPQKPDPEVPDGIKAWSKLALRIHKTKCIQETDGFLGSDLGEDEIRLGGYLTNPVGDMSTVGILNLGDHFDSGDVANYHPPKQFGTFSLGNQSINIHGQNIEIGWPRTYFATLILSEADNGGFPDFLNDVLNKVKDLVKQKVIEAAVGAGATIGGVIGAAIGAALGALFAYLIDGLVGVFITIWEDDVFAAVTISQTLEMPIPTWGSTHSPQGAYVWWKGHGGHYKVWYDWEMIP